VRLAAKNPATATSVMLGLQAMEQNPTLTPVATEYHYYSRFRLFINLQNFVSATPYTAANIGFEPLVKVGSALPTYLEMPLGYNQALGVGDVYVTILPDLIFTKETQV
jgi:hypothetical protein